MTGQDEITKAACVVLEAIEPGFVATYGDVARQLGISARQAGRVVSRVPDDVPWWRVVRADGTPGICRGGRAAGLLAAEGVPIRDGHVDLLHARYRWPAAACGN
ncbi:MGMT family protein [Brachybacterium aquaticum]|uniref:MGMT family protein n=1 Tax=Brachybacterium aquaticum TaxID=1432564 RepID=UPI0016070AAC|nr:MGMT family protein [Brachybacterium aquaticum]